MIFPSGRTPHSNHTTDYQRPMADYSCNNCGKTLYHPDQSVCRDCLDERTCIMCGKMFAPRRHDQTCCTGKHGCREQFAEIERYAVTAFVKALVAQGSKCWLCGLTEAELATRTQPAKAHIQREGSRLKPTCLDPKAEPPVIVAGCGRCRFEAHLKIATGDSEESHE